MIEKKNNLYVADSWEEMGIYIPVSKMVNRDIKIKDCPECKELGKRNEFSVYINPIAGKGKCYKCGTAYILREAKDTPEEKKDFTPPSRKNLTKLSDEGLRFFINRRISQDTVNQFKVVEKKEGDRTYMAYPYFYNGEVVNIKYKRDYTENGKRKKDYRQSSGGMHIVYNYDEAFKHNAVIVCEGEEEVMCWNDEGFPFAVSVDSGAPNPNDKSVDKRLECIDNAFDLFEKAKTIYIAVDNDTNGKLLESELIRRFDTEKVRVINFHHKDANDTIMYEGPGSLKKLIESSKEIKMEGIFTVGDVRDKLISMYRSGLPKGTTTHMDSVDRVWKWREGEVTLVSGYANDGKSLLYNINLPLLKAVFDGWKFGLFVPENFPAEEFYEDLIHAYIGKTTDIDYPKHRMSEEEYSAGMDFMDKHFFLVYPEKSFTLENIFERFDYLVRRHGINAIIIDPYNTIEHGYKPGQTIDQYVSQFMGELVKFTQVRRLSAILVAHQNKPDRLLDDGNYPEPDPYKTKNGGTFHDKTHNYVTLWRPVKKTAPNDPLVVLTSHKIKKKKLVANTGTVNLKFDWQSNRFNDPNMAIHPLDKFPKIKSEMRPGDLPF